MQDIPGKAAMHQTGQTDDTPTAVLVDCVVGEDVMHSLVHGQLQCCNKTWLTGDCFGKTQPQARRSVARIVAMGPAFGAESSLCSV